MACSSSAIDLAPATVVGRALALRDGRQIRREFALVEDHVEHRLRARVAREAREAVHGHRAQRAERIVAAVAAPAQPSIASIGIAARSHIASNSSALSRKCQ